MTGSKIHHGRAFTSAEQHHGSGQPHHHRRQPGRRRPELRFTNTGIAVTNLRVAVTQRIQQELIGVAPVSEQAGPRPQRIPGFHSAATAGG
jgi:hypothetical protein